MGHTRTTTSTGRPQRSETSELLWCLIRSQSVHRRPAQGSGTKESRTITRDRKEGVVTTSTTPSKGT